MMKKRSEIATFDALAAGSQPSLQSRLPARKTSHLNSWQKRSKATFRHFGQGFFDNPAARTDQA
jgi:hypothetical protein